MPHYLFSIIVDEDLITPGLATDNITGYTTQKKSAPEGGLLESGANRSPHLSIVKQK